MKKFIISLTVFCQILLAQAQTWIQIPDANFQNWLSTEFPDATILINTDFYLNADDQSVIGTDSLDLSGLGISNLTGVVAFSNLQVLYCNYNQLSTLPDLPSTLIDFRCDQNQLTTLTALPANLEILSCFNNAITTLPALPSSMTHLLCSENQLTSLPELPSTLEYLMCMYNALTQLPSLPQTLLNLGCSFNQLSTLPDLPSSLVLLHCIDNQLTSLPELPNALEGLYCSDNQLTSLPNLPENLLYLFGANNQINSLPLLPETLSVLSLSNNEINCFPLFPASLILISIDGNPYTCLPNYTIALGPDLADFPLCEPNDEINNPNNCASFLTSHVSQNELQEINVFPNPAENQFFVQWSNMVPDAIYVYSTAGVLVHEQMISGEENFVEIYTTHLSSGMYMVQVGELIRKVFVK